MTRPSHIPLFDRSRDSFRVNSRLIFLGVNLYKQKITATLFLLRYLGENNGNLPLRICPGCSVPEPYRSPDWVLVPAKTGLRAGVDSASNRNEYQEYFRGVKAANA